MISVWQENQIHKFNTHFFQIKIYNFIQIGLGMYLDEVIKTDCVSIDAKYC